MCVAWLLDQLCHCTEHNLTGLETQHSPSSECGLIPVVEWNRGCDVGEDRLADWQVHVLFGFQQELALNGRMDVFNKGGVKSGCICVCHKGLGKCDQKKKKKNLQ